MYIYTNSFQNHNDNYQPYSVHVEKNSDYKHNFGRCENEEYTINCAGGRHILLTPELQNYRLTYDFSIVKPMLNVLQWGAYIGYNEKERSGHLVVSSYTQSTKRLVHTFYKVSQARKTKISYLTLEGIELEESVYYPYMLEVCGNKCTVSVNGTSSSFEGEFGRGVVALTKQPLGGAGYSVKNLVLTSEDEVKYETLFQKTLTVPRYDGSHYEYVIDLEIKKYENGVKEITSRLHGGVEHTVKNNPKYRSWTSEFDIFEAPYIRFMGDCPLEKLYLKCGTLTFIDNVNSNSKTIGALHDAAPTPTAEAPYTSSFNLKKFIDFDFVVFGYDHFKSFRRDMEGDESEFVFDKDAKLVYYGRKLEKEFNVLVSSPEKSVIREKILASDFGLKEDALRHIDTNHYFASTEEAIFHIDLMHRVDSKFVEVEAELQNVFYEKICDVEITKCGTKTNAFGLYEDAYRANLGLLSQNVYHLEIRCYKGGILFETHTSAFEVIDFSLDISPIESSGLPFLYAGDGKLTTPTPWVTKPDFNIVHYMNGIACEPELVEDAKTWELLDIYRRKKLVWFTQRTAGRETYKDRLECIKHTDYLNYAIPGIEDSDNYYRWDHFRIPLFTGKFVKEMYNEFVSLHKEYNLVPVDADDKVSFKPEHYLSLEPCFDEWVDFANEKIEVLFREQWAEIKAVNPNIKRYCYGPFNAYATNCTGGEVMRYFGYKPDCIGKYFDGFVQYEDYTFCCHYPIAFSTWGMTTARLLAKDLNFAPELYDSFEAGCPDGHVSFPAPPFSVSYAHPYQTTSQIYGYLYNSLYYSEDGFNYWQGDKFMTYGVYNFEPQERFKNLVSSWGRYLKNKPKKPKNTVAYLHKLINDDNRFALMNPQVTNKNIMYNKCGITMSYIYIALSEMGIPAGFASDTLRGLTENDIDLLVIPSTKGLTKEDIKAVKSLHASGVKLIATGSVEGLENIFGVKANERKVYVNELSYKGENELVMGFDSEFLYTPNGADTVLSANGGEAVVMKNGNAALINVSLAEVGAEDFPYVAGAVGARHNVSELVRECVNDLMREFTKPTAVTDGDCYVNIFETESGDDEIFLFECSEYVDTVRRVTVTLNTDIYKDVEIIGDDNEYIPLIEDGVLRAFEVMINTKETLLFKLIK